MRERLLAAFLSLTLLTVMLYGVPRAFLRADVVNEEAQREVERSAQIVATLLETRLAAGLEGTPDLSRVVALEDQVVLRQGDVVERLSGAPRTPVDALVARAEVAGRGEVEVRRPRAVVRQDVVRAIRPIVLIGLAALAVAALAGVVLAGRLARPFARLAEEASSLGRGGFHVDLPPQRIREAESIASALRTSATRIGDLVERERDFARNASHQLRTPLTGMRLRVEDLAAWPETPPVVREELEQVLSEVDRLSDTVTSLLAFAREQRAGTWERVSLAPLVSSVADRWRGLAREQGRDVRLNEASPVDVALPRIAVEQVLDVLVDNALKHGRGTVTLAASADDAAVRLVVQDEGELPGGHVGDALLDQRPGSAGEGIGLGLSADLVRTVGGRLRLVSGRPTTFELMLPRRDEARVDVL